MANARIRALSVSMTGKSAIKYLQDKFEKKHDLALGTEPMTSSSTTTEDSVINLSQKLPLTKTWSQTSISPIKSTLLSTLNLELNQITQASTGHHHHHHQTSLTVNIPNEIKTGLSLAPGPSCITLEQWPEVQALTPVPSLDHWKAHLRIGLIALISGEKPLVQHYLPECFYLDVRRLHGIQNKYQKLLVLSAGVLALKQARNGVSMDEEEIRSVKRRLEEFLMKMQISLDDLARELAESIGLNEDDNVCKCIKSTLRSLINRQNMGFKALNNGLIKALCIILLTNEKLSDKKKVNT